MDFIPRAIEEYSENHTTPESEILYELNRVTNQKILRPRMLSGHIQGRILSMFSKMMRPKSILEIGTYTGYSAICMAEGLAENGILHTIDINEELEDFANSYFKKAGFESKIKMHVGAALEVVKNIRDNFDLVFIDADKENYVNYYNLIFDRVNPGGFIIVDNVLWSGKVAEENPDTDKETQTLIQLNDLIMKDDRVENVLVPVRDGLMVVRKL